MMVLREKMFNRSNLLAYCWMLTGFASCQHEVKKQESTAGNSYYLSLSGNDSNDGSIAKPWKSVSALNKQVLHPGDTVYFESAQVFAGSILLDSGDKGSRDKPIVLTSYGPTKAWIDGGNSSALTIHETEWIKLINIGFKGNGRKTGNSKDGVIINNSSNITVDSLTVHGFQKSGLLVYASANIAINRVYAYDNGFAGIFVSGRNNKSDCHDVLVSHCTTENNPGDPTNFNNHSGNGILAGFCKKVTIEYSAATNNGWDMPRTGNGPVGIWTYESDSVIIQHCISYRNKTSAGGNDGGGFDFDGGVTNSIIQYCLSYENQGSGFGLFQYAGASNWNNNVIRYNISENDGAVTGHCAGILVWNSSGDASQLSNCYIYNNTIYNSRAPALAYASESTHTGFHFYNNILTGKDAIITGNENGSQFIGNDWYSLNSGFMIDGMNDFRGWASANQQEIHNNQPTGLSMDPLFPQPGNTTIIDPNELNSFNSYQLPAGSVLRTQGIDLKQSFSIDNGTRTFNQLPSPLKGVGASF